MHRFLAFCLIVSVAAPAFAAADSVIRSSVAVCDPNSPLRCAAPDSLGNTPVVISPTAASGAAITPVASGAAAASLVLKASAGNLYSASAVNATATAGFCLVVNLTAAPGSGSAVTPLAFAVLPASGQCSINYAPGPPAAFSTGITFLVSSNASPYTFTSGVITAGMSGLAQ